MESKIRMQTLSNNWKKRSMKYQSETNQLLRTKTQRGHGLLTQGLTKIS